MISVVLFDLDGTLTFPAQATAPSGVVVGAGGTVRETGAGQQHDYEVEA